MIVVLLTTVATTFAWVGVFANSTFSNFDVKIKTSSLEEYGVELSLDGKKFSNEIDFNDIKPQILKNWGYNIEALTETQISDLFSGLNLDQCSTVPNIENDKIKSFGSFYDIFGNETKKLFKFDIYISAVNYYTSDETSTFKLDLFLNKGLLTGTKNGTSLWNTYKFDSSFSNPYNLMVNQGKLVLPDSYRIVNANESISYAKVDSSSAARIGFEKYEVVEKGHPEQYTSSSKPVSAVIYQDSYEYPVYDSKTETYDFGGILPDDYNLAIGYYNSTEYKYYKYSIKSISLPDNILNTRSVLGVTPDIRLTSKTNQFISSSNVNEQIGINDMMKVTCYFWFEGWDADCFPAINYSNVFINIGFVLKNEEEF